MFPRFRRSLSVLPSSSLLSQVRTRLVRFPVRQFSLSSSPHSCTCNVRVQVWWDVDNCDVPRDVSLMKVAPSIMAAVRANGIKGPIEIRAFGDFLSSKYSELDKKTLVFSGIQLFPIKEEKKSAFQCLLRDLTHWVSENPPPVHHFLILGRISDNHYSSILIWLRNSDYNILIAWSGWRYEVLCNAATIVWQWSSLLNEENLIGKHFTYARDDLFNSWYGDLKVHLGDPTCSQNSEIDDPSSDINSVSREVKNALRLFPLGVFIEEFREFLTMCGLPMDKGLYEQRKFANLLASMPGVETMYFSNRNFCMRLIPSKTSALKNKEREGTVATMTSALKNKERDGIAITKTSVKNKQRDGIATRYVSCLDDDDDDDDDDDEVSFQAVPSQGKHIGEYVDGKSSFLSFKESNMDQDVTGTPELFSIGYFWDGIKSFLFTPRGWRLISQSRSREDLAHKLQNHGPLSVTTLTEGDIFQLVELLIVKEKWLEESPSQAFPFRLRGAH